MHCRFENRINHTALCLDGFVTRLEAYTADQLQSCLTAIEDAHRAGYWVALLLDYELGEWLYPEHAWTRLVPRYSTPRPRLSALVYQHALHETPWIASGKPTGWINSISHLETQAHYLEAIQTIQDRIRQGDFYQINYTQALAVNCSGDLSNLYRRIAHTNPTAYAAFIEDGERTILSFSPELCIRRQGDRLSTRPMKGTAPRFDELTKDQQSAQSLLNSPKNRAENLMIVDLLRNDLGRIARTGTVTVERLFELERYPSVWTLTSTISALAPNASLSAIIHALFPCGSITGAPKLAAMQTINQLETHERGIYCGSIGWLAPNGDLCLNVAIRTLEMINSEQGFYGTGGGIVIDSEGVQEWQECLWKSRLLNDGLIERQS